ncbi:transglycosylase domain-containing protein [Streptomyces sp. NPDC102467]|uniref:transglycosylase domain-containing protein n=1 Tax=Streptomyces sp. NPDC102467 TaxID=3366179 RepID=UPI00380D41B0
MSEHRRKPPQPQGGGRAAARRGASGEPSGRRAAPRGSTESPSDSYDTPSSSGSYGGQEEDRPWGGRAEARRAAQRGSGGRRRAAPDGGGAGSGDAGGGGRRGGGGPNGPGRGRGRGSGRPQKKRFIDYPRAGKSGAARFVPSWKQVVGTCFGFMLLGVGAFGIGLLIVSVPIEAQAAQAQSNVFYWDDGTQMAATGGQQNRQIVPMEQIPKSMRNAVISAENASFYDDSGVDPMGIARAMFNMARGGQTQGGSTITQQYVKNAMLDDQSQSVSRKAKELFISVKVGATVDKDDILKGYLNTAYFGRNAYGIQAAARAYFDTESSKLTPEQSIFLASVLKGPNLYNPDGGIGEAATPAANKARAMSRWKWIADREVTVGNMSKAERSSLKGFPEIKKQKSALSGQTGYLVDIAKDYVSKKSKISPEDLEKGGYKIYTTFNKKKVEQMQKAVKATEDSFLDSKKRAKDKYVQFGAGSVDPNTGAIVALYGGAGYDQDHYTNNANTAGVPVGSTWKPFVLASAMEYGTYKSDGKPISPMSLYNGNDLTVIKDRNGDPIRAADGTPFRQKNESARAWGDITLRKAMEQSVNSPFVQLGIDVGLEKTRELANKAGILEDSFDKGNLGNASFSLGTSTPSAIRMADAYGSFATSGAHYEPYSVTKALNKDGTALKGFEKPKQTRAMDASVADNVTDVLQNVVKNGTGKKVADIGFPVAGKTGTTDENKSAWFVGYTPELSTAVTLFRTDPRSNGRKLLSMNGTGGVTSIHGGDIPAQIWKDYMAAALKGVDHKDFPDPDKIGEIVGTPTPTPTPSPSVTPSPTDTKPAKPSTTPTTSPTPSTSETCSGWDWNCEDDGGAGNGGTDSGGTTDGGVTTSPTESDPEGNPRGNENGGGLFGGTG